nr:hypothetical protein [Desulfobacula sp.]
MKNYFFILTIMLLIIATTAWCNEKDVYSASAAAVDGITQYYSSLSKLENAAGKTLNGITHKDLCGYLQENREQIITHLCETNAYLHLGHAEKAISSLYKNQTRYHAYGKAEYQARSPGYFDSATGHRYYRTSSGEYSEYSKTGRFLKTVPSNLPLLTQSRNICPLDENCYILYQQSQLGKKSYIALPGNEKHPAGWKAEKALVTLK